MDLYFLETMGSVFPQTKFADVAQLRDKPELALYDEGSTNKYFHAVLNYVDDCGVVNLTFFKAFSGSKLEQSEEFRLVDIDVPTFFEPDRKWRLYALDAYCHLRTMLEGKILSVSITTIDRDCSGREYIELFVDGGSVNRLLVTAKYAQLCPLAKLSVL